MKHNLSNNYMRCLFAILCCIMIIPSVTYAQTAESEVGTLQLDQEQYILKRTGEILVKIFGNVELDYNPPKVLLTHTTPDGESLTHNIRTNGTGYYEFYFVHDWHSIQGNYDVFVSKSNYPYISQLSIGTVTYELARDSSYKSDQQIKEEYWMNDEDKTERMDTVVDALYLYERIWNSDPLWVKNIFEWYYTNQITEKEVISTIQYLVKNNILKLD